MDIILKRNECLESGIFGEFQTDDGHHLCVTLEHAYKDGETFIPKVAPGTYKCVRHPPNRLPYETFMLENVPEFQGEPVSGILIHCGNFNKDSIGCILLGHEIMDQANGEEMITESKNTFFDFMDLQKDEPFFHLTIIE
jgi:hypothetical protein